MKKTMTFHRKKIWMVFLVCALMLLGLVGRLVYLMGVRSDYYYQKAEELHERERVIKAARGQILDAKGGFWQIIKLYVLFPLFTVRLRTHRRLLRSCQKSWK